MVRVPLSLFVLAVVIFAFCSSLLIHVHLPTSTVYCRYYVAYSVFYYFSTHFLYAESAFVNYVPYELAWLNAAQLSLLPTKSWN